MDENDADAPAGVLEERKGVLNLLPAELWLVIMDRIEDPQDFGNFISVSPVLKCLAKPLIGERMLCLTYLLNYSRFGRPDFYNLRRISRRCKTAVDAHHMAMPHGYGFSPCPAIYLPSIGKVQKFSRDISGLSKDPFPFEIRCGLRINSPPDEDYPEALDLLQFWEEVGLLCDAIGHRIISLVLMICTNPNEKNDQLNEQIMHQVIFGCFTKLPNVRYLLFHPYNIFLQRATKKIYDLAEANINENDVAISEPLPYLPKLTHLEIMTLGGGPEHEVLANDFPACFLRAHGTSVEKLGILLNGNQLQYLEQLPVTSNLRELRFNITNCTCHSQHPEPNLLENLSKIQFIPDTPSLKTLAVKLTWHWRPVDLYHMLNWLSHRFANVTLDQVVLQSFYLHDHGIPEHRHFYNLSKDSKFSWAWISNLPPLSNVRSLQFLSHYLGSWAFLRPFRLSLEELTMAHWDPTEMLTSGFIQDKINLRDSRGGDNRNANKKTRIFEYFPKLDKLHVVLSGSGRLGKVCRRCACKRGITTVSRNELGGMENKIRWKERWSTFRITMKIIIFMYVFLSTLSEILKKE